MLAEIKRFVKQVMMFDNPILNASLLKTGFLEISVIGTRIWECERAHAHTPKSEPLYGWFLENLKTFRCN